YREVNSQARLAFQKDANGRLELRISLPAIIFQRASLLDSYPWNRSVVYFVLSILVLTIVLWPIAWVVRRHYGFKLDLTLAQGRWRLLIKLVCLIDLIFVLALFLTFSSADDLTVLSGKLDPLVLICQVGGVVGADGRLLVICAVWPLGRAPKVGKAVRWLILLIIFACVGFVCFVLHCHMVNFNLNY